MFSGICKQTNCGEYVFSIAQCKNKQFTVALDSVVICHTATIQKNTIITDVNIPEQKRNYQNIYHTIISCILFARLASRLLDPQQQAFINQCFLH